MTLIHSLFEFIQEVSMPEFNVVWEMDIEADSRREAAEKALAIHRNPESIATVFSVDGQTVDLGE
ncbi:hypothetical protein GS449_14865 [Rhodococcus hoagii]|nr:hypothetical protein [Prescottella equi]